MSKIDFSSKTVAELRKIAKEYGVVLGAGINKAGIIAKLDDAILDDVGDDDNDDLYPVVELPKQMRKETAPQPQPEQPSQTKMDLPEIKQPEKSEQPAPSAPERMEAVQPAQQQPTRQDATSSQVQFRAAWHNPSTRYSARPVSSSANRPSTSDTWGQSAPIRQGGGDPSLRIGGTVRPANFTPRFGPAAPQEPQQDYRTSYRMPSQDAGRSAYGDQRRPSTYGQQNNNYDRSYEQPYTGGYGQQPSYGKQQSYTQQQPYNQQPYGQQQPYNQQRNNFQTRRDTSFYDADLGTSNPAVSELLASGECADGSGILELHPDGYGFLRSEATFLSSSRDIYVSMAQVKRFDLRDGDYVIGKTRPQRDGDKYSAMLYITSVNGIPQEAMGLRPSFEELTPAYPTRRICMEPKGDEKCDAMRLVDLIAPLGFGHRALLLCPPNTGKRELLRDYANTIAASNPEAHVMVLMVDETPEEVTLFREQCHCPVLATTFDMSPELHLRLADLVLERAERLAEQQQDVVLIVDSLTRLSKTFTTAATQAGRTLPGMVNPASLFRAKKLFGAARSLKEGGSLTVIGAMSVGGDSKVDDAVVEEFRSLTNSELMLDVNLARNGVKPPINLQMSGTRRAELLLTPAQQDGISLLHGVLGSMQSSQAVPQIMSLMDKAATNDELLLKLKDWVALMQSGRPV